MATMDADRNLLFGVLALQADAITRSQFIDACALWASRKQAPLGDLLVEMGWITPADRTDIERLVERKLRRHGGDARTSLAELTGDALRQSLGGIADPEIRRSLAGLDGVGGSVELSTIAFTPESRDRYTLTRLHARGGIGRVWLARDLDLGRDVAVKELLPDRAGDPSLLARFLDEARITGQLEHPGVVPVYELTRSDSQRPPFYTMRFVRGRTLDEASRAYHRERADGRPAPLDFQNLLNAFVAVCQTVAYAHSRGVIHRDLKGQNVVLGDYGEVIVLDWGLAKLIDRPETAPTASLALPSESGRNETMPGQVLGTPAYMAPEQAEGRLEQVDHRSDIYGLGAILYEILTGQPPFTGGNTLELLRRVREEDPVPPRQLNPGVPGALEAIGLKALSKRPEDRYATVRELADDVRRFLADEPVSVFKESLLNRMARWLRRHRTAAAALLATAITALIGLSIGGLVLQRERLREREQQRVLTNYRLALGALNDAKTLISSAVAVPPGPEQPGPSEIVSPSPYAKILPGEEEPKKSKEFGLSPPSSFAAGSPPTPSPPPGPSAGAQAPAPVVERFRAIEQQFEEQFRRQNADLDLGKGP